MPLDIELRKTKRVVLALSKSGPNSLLRRNTHFK